ncbi:phospholipid phosphatase 1-like [Dreissena polymorpha]|uniref:Phosphatidic acid phosphatase type 2/haloperoxidase domain-containing protein n=1 Tax=Dreissena polymorpha TaxID=45954 RepID=A0A9D4QZR6_DREPO|nr:phospholipid phosphatase 1-like [Dreissena polymorpha]KAH3849751.1 hypothetical protein DPMN_092155 [Dreissena polymorpha]
MLWNNCKMEKCPDNRRVSRRRLTLALIVDVILFLIVGIPVLYLFLQGQPFIQGFLCDDPSISLPYRPDTISTPVLIFAGVGTSIFCVVIVEVLNAINRKYIRACPTREDFWFIAKGYSVMVVGFVVQELFVEFLKRQLGFLRPNFMDVCRPQFNRSLCPAYITEYTCSGSDHDADEIRDSRQSFPSGHSAFSLYIAVFYCFYIQRRLHVSFSRILKFFLQAALVFTASICGLSRIRDHKHHASDVIVGFTVGAAVAVFVYKLLAENLLSTSLEDDVSKSSMSTSTVSHDLCCTCATTISSNVESHTPAPLLQNGYFNDVPNTLDEGRHTSLKLKKSSPVRRPLSTPVTLSSQQELV